MTHGIHRGTTRHGTIAPIIAGVGDGVGHPAGITVTGTEVDTTMVTTVHIHTTATEVITETGIIRVTTDATLLHAQRRAEVVI
jgi:hypothetical protein